MYCKEKVQYSLLLLMCYSISVGREETDRPENMVFGRLLQWYGCLPGLTDEYSKLIWQQRDGG